MAERPLDELVAAVRKRSASVLSARDPSAPLPRTGVRSITEDSRAAEPGSLFCAIRGISADGHQFIDRAVDAGAVAVVAEETRTTRVPTVLTADSRRAIAHLAAEFHGHPADELALIGVTGTNGKTTIAELITQLATAAGLRSRSFGTLSGGLTTAPAPEFQRELRRAVDDGIDIVASEVSSHALDQRRVDATRFRIVLFTNLTQDHLDYHIDMESYFRAKRRLFERGRAEVGIVDVSSEYGRRIADEAGVPIRTVDPRSVDAPVVGARTSEFGWRGRRVRVPLGGRFNIANALLAAESLVELGVDVDVIVAGLAEAEPVPGRFEWVDCGQPFGVIVDYSHTPASLEAAIAAATEITDGRVIVVFGSAGDRDPGKRPLMGAATSRADVVFVTSDNPRSEDPDSIIREVLTGIGRPDARRITERGEAIEAAIAEARPGDTVLIAGKGHEDYQIIGGVTRRFDDRVVAATALAGAGWDGAP